LGRQSASPVSIIRSGLEMVQHCRFAGLRVSLDNSAMAADILTSKPSLERPIGSRTFIWMLLVVMIVYGGLAVYSIVAPHSEDPRYWSPDWVAQQYRPANGPRQEPSYWSPDSVWYVSLAKGLLNHHHFSRQTAPPFRWEPYRTPGYPILIALGILITGHEWGALLFTPLFAGLMAWSVIGLTQELWRNAKITILAGWLAILLPPCLGLSENLLTDYVHGCLTTTAFYLTFMALRRAKWSYGIGAALAWSACQWTRPTSELAAVLMILIAVSEVRRRPQFLMLGFLVVTSFLTPLYMCYRTFQDHGVFTVSLLGRHVMRYHLVGVAEALATGQDEATTLTRCIQTDAGLAMKTKTEGAVNARPDLRSSFALEFVGVTEQLAVPLYNAQGEAIHDAFKRYPGFLVIAYVKGFVSELLWSPWDNPVRTRVMAHLMRLAYWLFLALAIMATGDARRHGFGWILPVLWLSFLFWVATASIAAAGGSRYRFPGDLLLIPLAAYGWMMLVARFGSRANPPIRREPEEFRAVTGHPSPG
jgi:hypothetical protein